MSGSSAPQSPHVPKRKTILFLHGFQSRFVMLVAGSLTVLLLFAAFHAAYVARNALSPEAFEAFKPALLTATWRLILVGVMYIGVVTLASVFLTHRIVGPTQRLEREILKIADGTEAKNEIHVRDGDEFEGLVGAINKLVIKVRGKTT